jgi:hypothetical protein
MMLLFYSASQYSYAQCSNTRPPTFTVQLPLVRIPPDEEGQGWNRPDIWDEKPARADSIVVPNGRPIYALIVSGYASNKFLDEMMLYNFARHLMAKGAYVHYAWWNNLLAPYMERPLHSDQSHPGALTAEQLKEFRNAEEANRKAFPGEDYQFVSDAIRFVSAIRQNNPNAIIIVAGHSMGGGAVVHLAMQTNISIDILAPIDPVGNRNFPFAGVDRFTEKDFNWTRWRVSRDNFLGYKKSYNAGSFPPDCQPTGAWLPYVPEPRSDDLLCKTQFFINNPSVVRFRSNIINLHHRYQQEFLFPFDYSEAYNFGHTRPLNSISTQQAVDMLPASCGFDTRCLDTDGWPILTGTDRACCPPSLPLGVGWNLDGHGEIVGYRGDGDPVPLGVRLKTSPQCGANCPNLTWPARTFHNSDNSWTDPSPNGQQRRQKFIALESLSIDSLWSDRPARPQLCKVSQGLINLFDIMNKPPIANAGNNLLAECNSNNNATVTLDGSASADPDNDELEYSWSGSFGTRTGKITSVTLPVGTHCITLTVKDPSGHIDKNKVSVTVQDKIGPVMNVSLTPSLLWPPNHKFVEVSATVNAVDACGTVESIVLYSIVASEGANIIGSGNTSPDITGADYNTHDLVFKLRAERSGPNRRRVYTVTYKATDNAGNTTFKSAEVVVENPSQ